MPGHAGLVETDDSSPAIHRPGHRWRKRPSPIGTAEHQGSRNDPAVSTGTSLFRLGHLIQAMNHLAIQASEWCIPRPEPGNEKQRHSEECARK